MDYSKVTRGTLRAAYLQGRGDAIRDAIADFAEDEGGWLGKAKQALEFTAGQLSVANSDDPGYMELREQLITEAREFWKDQGKEDAQELLGTQSLDAPVKYMAFLNACEALFGPEA